jgi:hypothetical protein
MAQHVFEKDGRRVFPHHRDEHRMYIPEPFVVEANVAELQEKGLPNDLDILTRHGDLQKRADPQMLYHRPPNSFNDPMSVYFVLDAICESRRGTYLRPWYLVDYLNRQVPQIHWTAGVVGRIMSGFFHLCEEMYINDDVVDEYLLPKQEFDTAEERHEAQLRVLPFAQGRDSLGRFYVLDPEGGNEGLLWMLMARRIWLELAEQAMVDDGDGHHGRNWGGEQAPTDYFMAHFSERAREARPFRNQLQGGATFQRPAQKPTRGIRLAS